jgi:hypothetical protein
MTIGLKMFFLYSKVTRLLPTKDNIPFLPVFIFFHSQMNGMIQRRKQVLQVRKIVPTVEHTYAQCKELHARYGHSGKCFLLGIGCQDANDINKALFG